MSGEMIGAAALRGRACITGIGETAVGRREGSTPLSLMEEAGLAALGDAGLSVGDLDGIMTCRSIVQPLHRVALILAERLGMRPGLFATLEAGGATSLQLLLHGTMAVASGMARHILCVAADNLRTGLGRHRAVQVMSENAHPELEVPLGTFPAAAYALVARAHQAQFGTTREQLAAVAVATRAWAQINPAAELRTPLSLEQALSSRPIAEPLGVADCALVSDGGGAFIVSSPDAADARAHKAVYVTGLGEAATHEYLTCAPSLTSTGATRSGEQAFAMAGLAPSDVDVAEIYDCFTITPIVLLEDLGFCKKGEGGPFVQGGRTAPGGPFSMNTHGGLLAHAHPGKAGGIFHLTEAVRQLRGAAGERQIEGAEIALVHGVGGMMSAHATALLSAVKP